MADYKTNNPNERRVTIEPNDKYENKRTLVFMESQSGTAEDLYRVKENKHVLIRQKQNNDTTVTWLTASIWTGGYEADCPVKDGIELTIVDKKTGAPVFTETTYTTRWNGGGNADKKYPFSWEEKKEKQKNRQWNLDTGDLRGFELTQETRDRIAFLIKDGYNCGEIIQDEEEGEDEK